MDVIFKENNLFYNVLCFLITENKKIFDRNDSVLYWRTVFHIGAIYHHTFIGLFAMGLELVHSPHQCIQDLYTFRVGFLTGWNFLFQTAFLTLALIHDALEWVDKNDSRFGTRIKYWRDVLFSGLAFPMSAFVAGMFWTLFWIDRELVFPKVFDEVVPWWFNHCVHTNIMVVVALETLLQPRRHPADEKVETSLIMGVAVLYAITYYSIYFFAHRWLYQVFAIMNWWQVCLFQIGIWISNYIFYRIQFPINRLFHSEEEEKGKDTATTEVKDTNGEVKEDGVRTVSEIMEARNGFQKNGKNHVKFGNTPKFDRSWSLKYRSIREQFEKSNL